MRHEITNENCIGWVDKFWRTSPNTRENQTATVVTGPISATYLNRTSAFEWWGELGAPPMHNVLNEVGQ